MLTGMGLALGIDYSLFVVSRYCEERAGGAEQPKAIAAAGATASRAVLFSGSMFVVAMIGMLLVPSNIMKSLAVGAIAVGITSVLAALTLLPALLGLLGDRVNALRVPWLGRNVGRAEARESRFWGAIVRRVMQRPAISLALFGALLLVAASPVLGFSLGASGVSTLPGRLQSKQGSEALARDFPRQSASPVLIVVEGACALRRYSLRSPGCERSWGRLRPSEELVTSASHQLAISRPSPRPWPGTRPAVALLTPCGACARSRFRAHLRAPLVGGGTADNVDFIDAMNAWLPIVFAFVLGLSFVLLRLVFRSIVVAATAIVLNLLSVGAAYGLIVLVFEHGVGSGLLGFQRVDAIEAWVPLFLFSVPSACPRTTRSSR